MTIKQFLRQVALLLLLSFSVQSGFPQPLLNDALRVQNPAQTDVVVGLKQSLRAGVEEKPVDPNKPVPPNEITIRTDNLNFPIGPNTKITIDAGQVTFVPAGTSPPQESSPPAIPVEPPRALPAPPTIIPAETPVVPEIINRGSISSEPSAPVYSPARPFRRLLWAAAAGLIAITGVTIFSIHQSGKSWKELFSPSVTQIVPEQIESDINPPEQLDLPVVEPAGFPQVETISGDKEVIQAAAQQAGEAVHPPKENLPPGAGAKQLYENQIALLQNLSDAHKVNQPSGQSLIGRLRVASVPGEDTGRNRVKAELARGQSATDQAAAAVIEIIEQDQFTKTASPASREAVMPATWKKYNDAVGAWFAAQRGELKRLVDALAGFVEKDRALLPGDNILLRDYYLDLTAHRLAGISAEELEENHRLYGFMVRLGVALPFSNRDLPDGIGYGPSMVPAIPVPDEQVAPAGERPRLLQETIASLRALLELRAKRIDARLAFLDWEIQAYREMVRKDPQSRTAAYDRLITELKITSRLSWVAQRRRIREQQNYLKTAGLLLEDKGKTNLDLFEAAQSRLREAEKAELYEQVFFYTGGTRAATWLDAASGKRVSGSYAFTGAIAYLDSEVLREQRNYDQFHRNEGDADQFELRLARQRRRLAQLEYEQAVSNYSAAGLRRILGLPTGAGLSGLNRAASFVRDPNPVVLFPELEASFSETMEGLDLSDRMLTDAQRQVLTVYGLPQDLPEPARKKAAATAVTQSQRAKAISIRSLWQQRVWAAQEAEIARRLAQSELEAVSDNTLDAVYQEELNSVRIFETRRLVAELLMEGPLTLNQLLEMLKIPSAKRQGPEPFNRWLVFSNDADLLDFLGLSRWDLSAAVGASDPARYQRLRQRHDESVQLTLVARRFVNGNRIDAKRQQADLFERYKISTDWDAEKIGAEIAAREWMVRFMTELLARNNRQMAQGMPLFPGDRPVAAAVPSLEDLAGIAAHGISQEQTYGGSVMLDGLRVPLTGGSYRQPLVGVLSGLPPLLAHYQLRDGLAGPRWVPAEQLQPAVVHDSSRPSAAAPADLVFAVRQGPPGSPFLDNGSYTFVRPGLLPVADAPIRIAGFIQPASPKETPVAARKLLLYLPVRQMRLIDGRPEMRVIGLLSREISSDRLSSEMDGGLDPQDEQSLRTVFSPTPRGDLGTVHRVGDFLRGENGEPLRFLISSRPFFLKIGIVSYPENGKITDEIRFERIPAPGNTRSGLQEFSRVAEQPAFQVVVISAETAARYPQLAGAEEKTHQWKNLQLVILSPDPVRWSGTIAGWLARPNLNLTLYGDAGDASLAMLQAMLAGAEESIALRGPYHPRGQAFSALFRMIVANLTGLEESAVSDLDLRDAAGLIGLGKYV